MPDWDYEYDDEPWRHEPRVKNPPHSGWGIASVIIALVLLVFGGGALVVALGMGFDPDTVADDGSSPK